MNSYFYFVIIYSSHQTHNISSGLFQFMYMLAQIHCPLVFCSSCLMFLFWKLDVFVGVLSTSAVCSVHRRVPERASGSHSCWGELVMLCSCSPGNEVGWDSRRRWYKHLRTWAIACWHPTSSQNLSPSQTAPIAAQFLEQSWGSVPCCPR